MRAKNLADFLPHPGDFTGALGDAGLLASIFLALAVNNGLAPARTLVLLGLTYVATALSFRLPMPVQPLKAMAAVALAQGLQMNVLHAAAIWMGAILLALRATGGIRRLAGWFSPALIKGIQLGVGLLLFQTGVKLALLQGHPAAALPPSAGMGPGDFATALWLLVIPQLPLTLGNAVFATSDAARQYFGARARRASPENVATSIALANLAAGTLGGMPVCHGSGGLTAHVRFGARSAWATGLTGLACLGLALAFGDGSAHALRQAPNWLLGGMIAMVGVFHAGLARGLTERTEVALVTGCAAVLTGNLAVAMGLGMLLERWPVSSRHSATTGLTVKSSK